MATIEGHTTPRRDSLGRVSIIIKAFNEERRIERAIESAMRAVDQLGPGGGEVVLADSCSTDRTLELAARYPIRIVQLADAGERCCGIGPQLGYQYTEGTWLYILDGDMELLPDFLPAAIAFLEARPEVAGVAGQVIEANIKSLEYLARAKRAQARMRPGRVEHLEMGGLYRRSAVEQAGYFSDRNLHSYEELDLAARLRVRGWRLWRLGMPSVLHEGHDEPALVLLRRRWRSRYLCGLGELVRAAQGQPHWRLVLGSVRELRLYAAVIGWWLLLATTPLWPLAATQRVLLFMALLLAPVALMTSRTRDLRRAAFSVVSWSFHAAGLLRGLAFPRRPPHAPVRSTLLVDGCLREGAS
ncbi:MAG: glycosyltransferase [Ramlibacter sp.]